MIPVPVNFVVDCSDEELISYRNIDVHNNPGLFTGGNFCWCLQTYLILSKRNKVSVECSNRLVANAINLVHSDQLLKLKGQSNNFIVCIRADYPKRLWAHYHIVQNKTQITSNTSFVPHWLQPGLIERDSSRVGISKVAYSGQTFNGNLAGNVEDWKEMFKSHSIEFINLNAGSWHDLSSIDVLVAVRSFDKKPHNTKPPSKLFSAWHAKIPLVAGYDSAYEQFGTPGKNYLIAKTPEEVINAVLQLKNDYALYKTIVSNGTTMASVFNESSIAETWEEVLNGSILERYKKWTAKKRFEKVRFNFFLSMGIFEHELKQLVKKSIRKI